MLVMNLLSSNFLSNFVDRFCTGMYNVSKNRSLRLKIIFLAFFDWLTCLWQLLDPTWIRKWTKTADITKTSKHVNRAVLTCFFFHWDVSVMFSWDNLVVSHSCIKTRLTVFIGPYFQVFWPNWLNFFRLFQKKLRSLTEKRNPVFDRHSTAEWIES